MDDSGYGERAGRALAALVLLVGVLFALLTQFGLSASTAVQQMTAKVPAAVAGQGQEITVDVKPVAPTLLPLQGQRWTADRMDKAIRIAVGSVVFRDSGTPLTRPGTWTVMAGRALGRCCSPWQRWQSAPASSADTGGEGEQARGAG
ncbi:hypothetical protein ALI144C_13760 [Actinosynnema sp. ALI-1.44]|uniref:hypothetical protein n=1 Tax=Actinosynnema sp. ALI-1.44 TaxID=1933779 RepID=UPI00097C87E8|nr:hypothetical protein [Actinosynnema sp. ALI-1.44]ONI85354.1 hypothetical protein ALI144C_13760 [Actinosynnema sp. ALI-1.44]